MTPFSGVWVGLLQFLLPSRISASLSTLYRDDPLSTNSKNSPVVEFDQTVEFAETGSCAASTWLRSTAVSAAHPKLCSFRRPALSLLIRELENQLGFRLFDRTTRHVQLTPLGSELLEVTRRSVQELDAAVARLGQTAKGVSRSISVGVTPLVAANVLPAVPPPGSGWPSRTASGRPRRVVPAGALTGQPEWCERRRVVVGRLRRLFIRRRER